MQILAHQSKHTELVSPGLRIFLIGVSGGSYDEENLVLA